MASATLTIPAGKVASTLTDFVTRVDLSHLPSTWWSDVTSGGGNIRVRSNGADLPVDVVTADTTARTGVAYFKATLTATGATFTVDAVPGATKPAATDPIGRNAAWSGHAAVFDFAANENLDRTGSAITLSLQGGALIQNGRLELVNQYANLPINLPGNWSARAAWCMTAASQCAIFTVDGPQYGRYLIDNGDRIGLYYTGWAYPADASVSVGNWYSTHATWDGTNQRIYGRYGSTSATRSGGGSTPSMLRLGYSSSDNEFTGHMQRVAVAAVTRSDAWVAAEHVSWETPASFYTIGSVSGGTNSATLAATLPPLRASLAGAVSPPPASGTLAATLPPLSGALTGTVSVPPIVGTLDGTLPALTGTLAGTSLPPGSTTGSLSAVLPSLSASLDGFTEIPPTVPQRVRLGVGLVLGSSAVTEVIAPVEDGDASVPLHVITPTVPAPTLTQGRPL